MKRKTLSNLIRTRASLSPHFYFHLLILPIGLLALPILALSSPAHATSSSQSDQLTLSINSYCTFHTVGNEDGSTSDSLTYTGTGIGGTEIELGTHPFVVNCNDTTGYSIHAYANPLVYAKDSDGNDNPNSVYTIEFNNLSDYNTNKGGNNSYWTTIIDNGDTGAVFGTTPTTPKVIKSSNTYTMSGGDTFSVTYKSYIGRTARPGTYTGTAVYQLALNVPDGDEDTENTFAKDYSITYDANGGENAPSPQQSDGQLFTIPDTTPTRVSHVFLGWSADKNSNTPRFYPGDNITVPTTNPHTILYAIWKLTPTPSGNMQDIASRQQCLNAPTHTVFTMTDARTNYSYLVTKMADGNCWMTQNLSLKGKGGQSIERSKTGTYNLPSSLTVCGATNPTNCFVEGTHEDATMDEKVSNTGSYFTWDVATAGTGGVNGSGTNGNPGTIEASDSVCPKGWSLPSGGNSGQFYNLYLNPHYNNYANFNAVWLKDFTGDYRSGGLAGNSSASWWSSTQENTDGAYRMFVSANDGFLATGSYRKLYGLSVRCLTTSS